MTMMCAKQWMQMNRPQMVKVLFPANRELLPAKASESDSFPGAGEPRVFVNRAGRAIFFYASCCVWYDTLSFFCVTYDARYR